jgi:hypothetical protein
MVRKNAAIIFMVLFLIVSLFTMLYAEEESESPLARFSSIIGHWRGEGLGGICEETWLPESGGVMLGTFKSIQEGKVSFTELMMLSVDSIGPAVRIKHFNGDFTAWEDKAEMVTFRYDSTVAGEMFFSGLRFFHPGKDSLAVGVMMGKSDSTASELLFKYERVEF